MKLKFIISPFASIFYFCKHTKEEIEIHSASFINEKKEGVFRCQVTHPVDINLMQGQWFRSVFYSEVKYAYKTTGSPIYLGLTEKCVKTGIGKKDAVTGMCMT